MVQRRVPGCACANVHISIFTQHPNDVTHFMIKIDFSHAQKNAPNSSDKQHRKKTLWFETMKKWQRDPLYIKIYATNIYTHTHTHTHTSTSTNINIYIYICVHRYTESCAVLSRRTTDGVSFVNGINQTNHSTNRQWPCTTTLKNRERTINLSILTASTSHKEDATPDVTTRLPVE